ncbi:MAG: hypothetical protein H6702_21385 [Myxococcales bacterium]|nr:hypothetical protein [Myxococcales bacterium]
MRPCLPILTLALALCACADPEPARVLVDGGAAADGALLADGPAADRGLPPDQAPPDSAVVIDAEPPPPTCADDDQDGDGYGTGPACPAPDCDDGNAAIYPGAVEACDGGDDDCDGVVDEGLYTARCGVGACAREVPNCLDGAPNLCEPGEPVPETCNGEDDDCDGAIDEAAGDAACGVGACVRAATCGPDGPVCNPAEPAAEACNGVDDDCDGATDEALLGAGTEVRSYAQDLQPRHGGCDGYGQRIGPECNAAIHRHCADQGCRDAGFGPVENSGDVAHITCLAAEKHNVPFGDLQARHPGCGDGRPVVSPDCNAAIHRWCAANGYLSGFGPLEHGGGAMLVACIPGEQGQIFQPSYSGDLAGRHAPCNGTTQRMGPDCNAAIHRWCRGQGFESGFGPIENSGDTGVVTCVRR